MKCIKCGKKLRNNEKFCTYCGYYNDEKEEKKETEENLIDENWYDEEIDKEDDEEVELEPVKKEKKKKNKKEDNFKIEEYKEEKEDKFKVEEYKEEKKEKPKKIKKENEITEIKIKEDDEIYDQNERYIEAYIGEDYRLIKKSPFNIWAFLLNFMYLLYRKLFITGIIGLLITTLVAFFLTKYFLIYIIIVLLIIGFGFNPYYIYIVKRKVNKILNEYAGSDSFTLENICKEKGGVKVDISLIIYVLFLAIIVLVITKPSINTSHNTKFWQENAENKANCTSLIRLVYKEEKNNYDKIEEALCKVKKDTNNYELYLKTTKSKKTYYVYYETENDYLVFKHNTEYLEMLNKKKKENKITSEEDKILREIKVIESNYKNIYTKSNEEDKQIKRKTNKEEKLNYIFTYEELIR